MKNRKEHRLYARWKIMRQRCNNQNTPDYKRYGARGIKLCNRWNDFWLFVEDMYPSFIEGMTIERKDINGCYSPDNCIWIPNKEQANNRSTSHILELDGMSMNIMQWSKYAHVDRSMIYDRLNKPGLTTRQIIYGIGNKK